MIPPKPHEEAGPRRAKDLVERLIARTTRKVCQHTPALYCWDNRAFYRLAIQGCSQMNTYPYLHRSPLPP